MSTAASLAPGFELAGFRIEAVIGRGGMGVVYRAVQLSLDRPVALKLISPELSAEERFREQFLGEARLAASIDHPHVLPVYEAGEADGTLFLAMRLVDGLSLADLLRRERALSPEHALRLLAQLASALGAAHAAGLLHRDVKPHNVLLAGGGDDEHAYLCDFGLARRLAEGSSGEKGGFLGTATYAAPEQIRGEELNARCDLYSLACVFHECLSGRPPFGAENELAVLWGHLHDTPRAPSSLDPDLACFDPFFARALAKIPADRYSSAAELAHAAQEAVAGALLAAAPLDVGPRVELPRPGTRFLGRERELGEVLEVLLDEDVRLLTLTGPGGTGKTRLALRAAEEAAPAFPDGVYWVGLATLRDADLVHETIAQTLDAGQDLEADLADKRALLLLDNFEQVIDAAPSLASLLAACPNLSLLVTSRETLRVQAELEYQVPPLTEAEAIELFCRRARLEPSGEVAKLCGHLDNLPLAVELAAARTRALSPSQILERLSSRLDLLKGGRDSDPRQQTLRTTIEWSYELLTDDEQKLFRRLSVFAGGCTLEAAEEVCDADLDTMQSLLEKSLLRFSNERYWMLETIREYGASRFEATAESAAIHARHLAHVLDLAKDADGKMAGAEQSLQLTRVEIEHANVRQALSWALANDGEQALLLAVTLQRYFYLHGHSAEGLRVLELALGATPDASPRLRARGLRAAGTLADGIGDVMRGRTYLESSLELLRAHGDQRDLAVALNNLGAVATKQADIEAARGFLGESLELKRQLGDRRGMAMSLSNLGMVEAKVPNLDVAHEYQEEALATFRELEDESAVTNSLIALAEVAVLREEPARARGLVDEALRLAEHIGDRAASVEALALLARVALLDGDTAVARESAGRAAAYARDLEDAYTTVIALEVAADVLVDPPELVHAVRLRAAAAHARAESGTPEWPVERRQGTVTLERARSLLDPKIFERASADGTSDGPTRALALAASLASGSPIGE